MFSARENGTFSLRLKGRESFSPPGGPTFPEDQEKLSDDGALEQYPCVTLNPPSSSKMKPAILISDVESASECLLGINHDELPVIPMDILEGCPPFEGAGRPDMHACPSHFCPKVSRGSQRTKMIVQEIDIHSLPASLF